MSWYEVQTPHDKMRRGIIVYLEDTPDVELRVTKGHLAPAEEPEWAERRTHDDRGHNLRSDGNSDRHL